MSIKKTVLNLLIVATTLSFSLTVIAMPSTELICMDSTTQSESTTTFYLFERPFDESSMLFDTGLDFSMVPIIDNCQQIQHENLGEVICEGNIINIETDEILNPFKIVLTVSSSGDEGKGIISIDSIGTKYVSCK